GQGSFPARVRSLMTPVVPHRDVEPVLQIRRVSATRYLGTLHRFGRAPVDAKVALDGLRPVVTPARPGAAPDGNALLAAVRATALAAVRTVRLRFRPEPAKIGTVAARVAAAQASVYVSKPVDLRYHGNS